MINIKCLNKNMFFYFIFGKYAGMENCTKLFSAYFKHFFFYKQIKKIGVEGFSEKHSTQTFLFAYLLIFHRGGREENLQIYLAWPNINIVFNEIEISQSK